MYGRCQSVTEIFVYMSQYKQKNPTLFFRKAVHRFANGCKRRGLSRRFAVSPLRLGIFSTAMTTKTGACMSCRSVYVPTLHRPLACSED